MQLKFPLLSLPIIFLLQVLDSNWFLMQVSVLGWAH